MSAEASVECHASDRCGPSRGRDNASESRIFRRMYSLVGSSVTSLAPTTWEPRRQKVWPLSRLGRRSFWWPTAAGEPASTFVRNQLPATSNIALIWN